MRAQAQAGIFGKSGDDIDIVKTSDNLLRYCAIDTKVMVKLLIFIYALVNIRDEQIALPLTIQPSLN